MDAFWLRKNNATPQDRAVSSIEVESANVTYSRGSGIVQEMTRHHGYCYSGDKQILWTGVAVGDSLELTVTVDEETVATLVIGMTIANDMGMWDVFVNGAKAATVDCWHGQVSRKNFCLGTFTLNAGANTVKLQSVGKNGSASAYNLGFDNLVIHTV